MKVVTIFHLDVAIAHAGATFSQPQDGKKTNAFTPDRLARFRAQIEKETGAKVVLVGKDGL